MATSYTSLLGLALPVTGELAGTWGDTVNNSITALLDTAVAGTTTLSTDADVTLTTTTGATNQARQAILLCSGARTAVRNITAPAQSKIYAVINNTTGGYGVVIRGVGPTTGVTVASGKTAVVVWNGSDFVEVAPATATTATNLAGGAAGSLPYQSGAGATTFLSIGTNNFVLTSNGTAPVWTANTGTGNVVRATSPTLVTPVLGTPTSGTLTNCTGLPISTGVSGLGANVATFLATPSSANLAAAVTGETGSGALVFGTSPTLVTPTFTSSATGPLFIGGTGTTSTLVLRSTSGVGTTGADIIFQTGNNGATEAMRILNSGNVGIGTSSPVGILQVDNHDASASIFATTKSQSGSAPQWASRSNRGTIALPTAVQSGDILLRLSAIGYGSTTYCNAATIIGYAGGTFTDTSSPGYLTFLTTPSGSITPLERMRVESNGVLLINSVLTANARLNQKLATVSTGNGNYGGAGFVSYSGTTADACSIIDLQRSRGTTDGSYTIVASGDVLGAITFRGSDGSAFQNSSGIRAEVDAAPGAGDMPGRLVFLTASDGTATLSERMRIDSSGNVGIGAASPLLRLDVVGATNNGSITQVATFRQISSQLVGSGAEIVISANETSRAVALAGVVDSGNGHAMLFKTSPNGGIPAERMRIDSNGNVAIGTSSPVNKLDVVGSFGRGAPVTKTGNFTLAATENWVICNGTGTITVTLPAASSWTGREVMIKTIAAQTVVSASSNVVPLAGGAAGTAILAATAGRWATLVSDGTNWVIMSAA